MDVKELLDDESLDPKKFFNEEEYVTLIVNRDGFNKNQNDTADLIETLLAKDTQRKEIEDIFLQLKTLKANKLLVDTIAAAETTRDKAKLCAACWESGLDFTENFLFFTELACNNDFALAMEALTVVENIEGVITENNLTKALEMAMNCKSKNTAIIEFLITNIKQRIS
jgi:hypothetical protein